MAIEIFSAIIKGETRELSSHGFLHHTSTQLFPGLSLASQVFIYVVYRPGCTGTPTVVHSVSFIILQ